MMDQALEGLDEPLNITADEKEKNGNQIIKFNRCGL